MRHQRMAGRAPMPADTALELREALEAWFGVWGLGFGVWGLGFGV